MKDLICIVCPRGCHLHVDDEMNVTGNTCIRGAKYAVQELTNPTRNITSTVLVNNYDGVLPVKTDNNIPKDKIFDVMTEIKKVRVDLPKHIGDVIIENVLGLGVNIVATRNIEK